MKKKKMRALDMNLHVVPWPKAGDSLFKDDAKWSHNAFLNLGGKEWESYASGYKEAADVLVARFREDRRGMDVLAYPIVFLYRHYVELRLKQLSIEGRALLRKPTDFKDEHCLLHLWHPCRQVLCEVWPQEPAATWDAVEELLREFDRRDPGGKCFCYPVTTKKNGRQPTLPKLDRMGIRNLYRVMQRLASFFEGHLTGIDVYRQEESHL
jgi:hypothetical protein